MAVFIRKALRVIVLFLVLLSASFSPQAAFLHDQTLDWETLESRHFSIHYHTGAKRIAIKTARISETFLAELQPLLDWIPEDKIDIIISDEVDFSNGSVMPFLPNSRMTLFVNPPDEAGRFNYQDWFRLLIKHEIAHALHLDKAKGKPKTLRKLFGNHPLLYPNVFQHAWLIEGLATYIETNPTMRTGRGQGSEFAMMMRSEVQNGMKSLRQLNSTLSSWPLGTANYLYGYYFFEFLEKQYTADSIKQFIQQYSNNLLPFNLNEAVTKTYHKDIEQLWLEFEEYLNEKFSPQINAIQTSNVVTGVALTENGYMKQYAEFIDGENILIGQYNAANQPSLYSLNIYDRSTKHIANIHTDTRIDYHETGGILLAQAEIYRNTNFFYDIYKISPGATKPERLTRGQRMRRAIWSPDGKQIVAVFSKLGQHSLILLESNGKIIDILWEALDREYIADIDWSPNGEHIIASVKRNTTSWNLEEFSLETKTWNQLTFHQTLETQPQYSKDGESIVYSADYDGVFNIYRISRNKLNIEKLTDVVGGAFQPKLSNKGNLLYLNYSAKGFDVFYIEQAVPLAKIDSSTLNTQQKNRHKYNDILFEIVNYSTLKQLTPKWWEPSLYFSKHSRRIGAFTSGSDVLMRHNYDTLFEWDFIVKKPTFEFSYSYDRWFPLIQTYIKSTKRKYYTHEEGLIEALVPILSRDNRWYFSSSISLEDDTRYTFNQQDKTVAAQARNHLLGFGMVWDSRRRYPKLHSISAGRLFTTTYETSEIGNSTNKGKMLSIDWREFIKLNKLNVLGLRLTAGLGIDSPRPFQLGGYDSATDAFDNSLYSSVRYRSNLYNKRRYALRGYATQTDSLIGRRMLMTTAEWRFPIANIERGFPVFPLALNKISGTLFYNGASVWETGLKPEQFLHGIGIEGTADTQLFRVLPIKLRLGIAKGLSKNGETQPYFTVGTSF